MVTNICFVGNGFTQRTPKYETFIRPMGLCTFQEGSYETSWTEGHFLPANAWCKQ